MLNQFSRTELLLGREGMEKLRRARVAVFGLGGVGGYAVEALARSGVGTLDLIDNDKICVTPRSASARFVRKRKSIPIRRSTRPPSRNSSISRAMITSLTPLIPSAGNWNWSVRPIGAASLLSVPWARETSWTPPRYRWRTFIRLPSVPWRGSCGGNSGNAGFRA